MRVVGHARVQAAADERQVRIGVRRLRLDLLGRELAPKLELVVKISGAFWKDRADDVQVRANRFGARCEPGGQILRKKAGSGVPGRIEAPRVAVEGVAGDLGGASPNVDDVEPCAGSQFKCQFKRRHRSN